MKIYVLSSCAFAALLVAGCGLHTPDKDPLHGDEIDAANSSREGSYESAIVDHVTCEIAEGLKEAKRLSLPWLDEWGVSITQSVTLEDQTGLSPGISTVNP